MTEFSNKILVENTKAYLQLQRQVKQAGYNAFLGKQMASAKGKIEDQITLYES
jgi:hypothetical protein